jgi:Flp pilus assembly protein CpaB
MTDSTQRRRSDSNRGLSASQLLLLGITALVILYFGYRQIDRHFGSTEVVVAKQPIALGQAVNRDQVKLSRVSKDEVPDDAIERIGDVVGKTIRRGVEKGGVLKGKDFAARQVNQTDLKTFIPEGRVLYGLNVSNQTLPGYGIMQGDSIDIMVAGASSENQVRIANVLVRDVLMVGYSISGGGDSGGGDQGSGFGIDIPPPSSRDDDDEVSTLLMLAVRPEDVVRLAEADGAGQHLAIVLHGKAEDGEDRLKVTNRERVQLIQGKSSRMISLP